MCLPTPWIASESIMQKTTPQQPAKQPNQPRPEIIALRKTCDAEGTGLSHYVLMDKQVQK